MSNGEDTRIYPHLAWFLDGSGWPYLYRRDARPASLAYDTLAEACEVAGLDLENVVRQM